MGCDKNELPEIVPAKPVEVKGAMPEMLILTAYFSASTLQEVSIIVSCGLLLKVI